MLRAERSQGARCPHEPDEAAERPRISMIQSDPFLEQLLRPEALSKWRLFPSLTWSGCSLPCIRSIFFLAAYNPT